MSHNDFWDVIYVDGDMDKDDAYGKWHENPKYVSEPPHVFVRREATQPKPSTDFTEPKANPKKDYLMWNNTMKLWEVCFVSNDGRIWAYHPMLQGGSWDRDYTHWFPMPDAPDT